MNMITILNKFSCFKRKVKSSLRQFESRSLSSSISQSFTPYEFDIFLSFRGEDTRKTFISFLYKELESNGFRTFKADKELIYGRPIPPELLHAIKGSRIVVVVVSKNYSASCWCLEELTEIMKLQEKGSLEVMPIFYDINPSDIRRQIGEVAKLFKKHEKRYCKEKVNSWKNALNKLATLSGERSKDWEDDSKLVDDITEKISNILFSVTPNNNIILVGIEEHMKKLYPYLALESNEVGRIIGIWGRGSAGRLALATQVYQNISNQFEAHCFLENVRQFSLHCGKSRLQKEFLLKIQGEGLITKSSRKCCKEIKARLRNKKILLVENDVDKIEQLDALVDEFNWIGPGSRIIVTTQDRQLLKSSQVKDVYELELLTYYEVSLCRSVAFKQSDDPVVLQLD